MGIEWLPFLFVIIVIVPVLAGVILSERRHKKRMEDLFDWRKKE